MAMTTLVSNGLFLSNSVEIFTSKITLCRYEAPPQLVTVFCNSLLNIIGVKGDVITIKHVQSNFKSLSWCAAFEDFELSRRSVAYEELDTFFESITDEIKKAFESTARPARVKSGIMAGYITLMQSWIRLSNIIRSLDPVARFDFYNVQYTRFDEGFAFIAVNMLKSAHWFRCLYQKSFAVLNDICNELYTIVKSAFYDCVGIEAIVSDLCQILPTGFRFFVAKDPSIVDIAEEIICLKSRFPSYAWSKAETAFTILKDIIMADKENTGQVALALDSPTTIERFLHLFWKYTDQYSIQKCWKFIRSSPWSQAFFKPKSASLLVASLTLICRSKVWHSKVGAALLFTDNVEHPDDYRDLNFILDFIFIKSCYPEEYMKNLVGSFMNYFTCFYSFDFMMNSYIHNKISTTVLVPFVVVEMFQYMQDRIGKYRDKLDKFLMGYCFYLDKIKCQLAYYILLEILMVVDYKMVEELLEHSDKIMDEIDSFLFEELMLAAMVENFVQERLTSVTVRFCTFRGTGGKLQEYGNELMTIISDLDAQRNTLGDDNYSAMAYSIALQKLSYLIHEGLVFSDELSEYFKQCPSGVPFRAQDWNVNEAFTDVYVYGMITHVVVDLQLNDPIERKFAEHRGIHLKKHFVKYLRTAANYKIQDPLDRYKKYFECLLDIFCSPLSEFKSLQCSESEYIILLDVIKYCIFHLHNYMQTADLLRKEKEDLFLNFPVNLVGQLEMLVKFAKMHKNRHLNLPIHLSWRVCMYFGWIKNLYEPLQEFMEVLLKSYKASIPLLMSYIVTNLYKATNDMKIVIDVICAHNLIMKKNLRVWEYNKMRFEIIDKIIDSLIIILKTPVKFDKPNIVNRLSPLKHLSLWTKDMSLTEFPEIFEIPRKLKKLADYPLFGVEHKFLFRYLRFFEGVIEFKRLHFLTNKDDETLFECFECLNGGKKHSESSDSSEMPDDLDIEAYLKCRNSSGTLSEEEPLTEPCSYRRKHRKNTKDLKGCSDGDCPKETFKDMCWSSTSPKNYLMLDLFEASDIRFFNIDSFKNRGGDGAPVTNGNGSAPSPVTANNVEVQCEPSAAITMVNWGKSLVSGEDSNDGIPKNSLDSIRSKALLANKKQVTRSGTSNTLPENDLFRAVYAKYLIRNKNNSKKPNDTSEITDDSSENTSNRSGDSNHSETSGTIVDRKPACSKQKKSTVGRVPSVKKLISEKKSSEQFSELIRKAPPSVSAPLKGPARIEQLKSEMVSNFNLESITVRENVYSCKKKVVKKLSKSKQVGLNANGDDKFPRNKPVKNTNVHNEEKPLESKPYAKGGITQANDKDKSLKETLKKTKLPERSPEEDDLPSVSKKIHNKSLPRHEEAIKKAPKSPANVKDISTTEEEPDIKEVSRKQPKRQAKLLAKFRPTRKVLKEQAAASKKKSEPLEPAKGGNKATYIPPKKKKNK